MIIARIGCARSYEPARPYSRGELSISGYRVPYSHSRHGFCDDLSMNSMSHDGLSSGLADSIGRVGFRKWYERELLSCHAYMLLCFLSMIGLLSSMEAFHRGAAQDQMTNVLFVVVCAAIGEGALA